MKKIETVANEIQWNRGALTIEAAVIVPFFFSIILSVLMISKSYSTYNQVEQALTKVSGDVSNAGFVLRDLYILDMVDAIENNAENELSSKLDELDQQTQNVLGDIDDVDDLYNDFTDAIGELKSANSVSSILSSISKVKASVQGVYVVVENILNLTMEYVALLKNPDTYIDMASIALASVSDDIKNYIGQIYVQYAMDQYFGTSDYEERLFIDGDISYEESLFYVDVEEIVEGEVPKAMVGIKNMNKITATYTLDIPYFVDIGFNHMELKNTVIIRGYTGEM